MKCISKKLSIYVLVITTLFVFSSCEKDDEISMNETVTYYPLTAGSTWTYQDEENTTYTYTLTNQSKNVGNADWKIITINPNPTDEDLLVRLDANSQIVYEAVDFSNDGGILITIPVADLDANVGDTWTKNNAQDGIFLNYTGRLLEKDVMKTINGKSYDKVMVVKLEVASNFFDEIDETLYFVRGIGLVARQYEDGKFINLINHNIK